MNRQLGFAFALLITVIITPMMVSKSYAQGTSTLSIEDALKEANAQSPEIQVSEAQADQSDFGKLEANANFLPHLSLDAIHYFDIKYQTLEVTEFGPPIEFPFVSPSTIYSLNVEWNIFNGFQDYDRLGAAKLTAEAGHDELDWSHFQVAQEIRLNFYQSIAARLLESVADENVNNLEQHLKQIQDMLKVGEAIEVDVIRVQVQLNSARTQKLNAHDSAIISQQHLAQSLGKKTESRLPTGNLPIPDEAVASKIESVNRDEAEKFSHRADLQATALRSAAAEKSEAAAANWLIPSLSVVGNYQIYNNENYELTNSNNFKSAYQYGLELKWNIFDGLLSYARSKEAAAASRVAVKSEALARLQASTDVETSQSNYRLNLSQYITNTENLERSLRSVQLALAGLRSGTQTNTDVLDAELDLFNARAGVIQSQMDALAAQIKFENAIGRNL
jgi:outer membrane protein TolC